MTAAINTGTVVDRIAVELGEELHERRSPSWTGSLMATAGATLGAGAVFAGAVATLGIAGVIIATAAVGAFTGLSWIL